MGTGSLHYRVVLTAAEPTNAGKYGFGVRLRACQHYCEFYWTFEWRCGINGSVQDEVSVVDFSLKKGPGHARPLHSPRWPSDF
jgi:hypothetical protein